jgi:DNA invertase Pin-like site-specific DNA recombinase
MKYVIDDILKGLTEAQKEGKTLITESELIQIATPKINRIDEVIHLVDKAIERYPYFPPAIALAATLTGISRQTFYRWVNKDIVKVDKYGTINLSELKKTLLSIKEIHETPK